MIKEYQHCKIHCVIKSALSLKVEGTVVYADGTMNASWWTCRVLEIDATGKNYSVEFADVNFESSKTNNSLLFPSRPFLSRLLACCIK